MGNPRYNSFSEEKFLEKLDVSITVGREASFLSELGNSQGCSVSRAFAVDITIR
uniref:Uncharacterized protein n=1 Tax=Moniliophthora roreri TaxID=221103 RepID=A0A0W0FBH3_MONRR